MKPDPQRRRRWAASYGLSLILHGLALAWLVLVAVDIGGAPAEQRSPADVTVIRTEAAPQTAVQSPHRPRTATASVAPTQQLRRGGVSKAAPAPVPQPRPSTIAPAHRPELARNTRDGQRQAPSVPKFAPIALPTMAPVAMAVPRLASTQAPAVTPAAVPTSIPSAVPSAAAVPSAGTSAIPSPMPIVTVSPVASAPPTLAPDVALTAAPTAVPSPIQTPAPAPSPKLTAAPTIAPVRLPTSASPSPALVLTAPPIPHASSIATPAQASAQTRATASPAARAHLPADGAKGHAVDNPSSNPAPTIQRPAPASTVVQEKGLASSPAPAGKAGGLASLNDRLKGLSVGTNVDYRPKRVTVGDAQGVLDRAMFAYEQRLAPPPDILKRTFGVIYTRRAASGPDSIAYVYDTYSIGPITMCKAWKIIEHPAQEVREVGAATRSGGIGGAVATNANSPNIRHDNGGSADVQTVQFPCSEKSYTKIPLGSVTTPLPRHPDLGPVPTAAPSVPQTPSPAPTP